MSHLAQATKASNSTDPMARESTGPRHAFSALSKNSSYSMPACRWIDDRMMV